MSNRHPYRPSAHRQRGAMGIFAALTMLLAFMFAALAVDGGRLWSDKRELQSVADIAALEAANSVGCGSVSSSAMVAAAQTAATRNGFTDSVNTGLNSVALGWIGNAGGNRVFGTTPGTGDRAVRVILSRTVPASLILGGVFGGTTTMTATATARNTPPQGSISVGSALLRVNTTSGDASLLSLLFGKILGGSLVLDAVSYKGLANANVSLLGLAHAYASAGTVSSLLNANIKVSDLLALTLTAMNNAGVADATLTTAINKLIVANISNLNINLGSVLKVTSPDSVAAGNAKVNVFDLISASLMVANGSNALSLALGIPGIATASVKVIEPPQLAVGPAGTDASGNWCTQAKTAQIRATVNLTPALSALTSTDMALSVNVATGEAHLVSITPQSGGSDVIVGATPGIITANLTNVAQTGPSTLASVSLLGITLLKVNLGLNLPIASPAAAQLDFPVTYPVTGSLPMTLTTSSGLGSSLQNGLSQSNSVVVTANLIGLPINLGLLNPILSGTIAPLLGTVGSNLLDPLLKLIGIQVGVVDVQLLDLQTSGSQLLI
jgi:uncharacterized membrane protein